MIEQEFAYLRSEFEVSWRHLGSLEYKRLWLFVGYFLFLGLLAVALAHADFSTRSTTAHSWDRVVQLFLAVALTVVSFACRNIARSERQATERYRNKINLLRRTLLQQLDSQVLSAMQVEGNANALQITSNAPKELRVLDLLDRRRWNTALFMKLTYDSGMVLGVAALFSLLVKMATVTA